MTPSSNRPGLFLSIDGPSGTGRSTTIEHLVPMLVAAGHDVHLTHEPSSGPIGVLARELTDTVQRQALAFLYTADRYHHLDTEIRPQLAAGRTVVTDRYTPSGLVMQRFDGVELTDLWHLNAAADRPDLTVILDADPDLIARRLNYRGAHNRLQTGDRCSRDEVRFYADAIAVLVAGGYNVFRVDCTALTPEQVAEIILSQVTASRPAAANMTALAGLPVGDTPERS